MPVSSPRKNADTVSPASSRMSAPGRQLSGGLTGDGDVRHVGADLADHS
jgi:hypothetical protein